MQRETKQIEKHMQRLALQAAKRWWLELELQAEARKDCEKNNNLCSKSSGAHEIYTEDQLGKKKKLKTLIQFWFMYE